MIFLISFLKKGLPRNGSVITDMVNTKAMGERRSLSGGWGAILALLASTSDCTFFQRQQKNQKFCIGPGLTQELPRAP